MGMKNVRANIRIRNKLKELNIEAPLVDVSEIERYRDNDDISSDIELHFIYKLKSNNRLYKGILYYNNSIILNIDVEEVNKAVEEAIDKLSDVFDAYNRNYFIGQEINDLQSDLKRMMIKQKER